MDMTDCHPVCLRTQLSAIVAKPLTHVINSMLQTGIVTEDLKHAIVTPIFKSRSKQDNLRQLDNYRPVSVLPTCSKIFEKVFHHQVIT